MKKFGLSLLLFIAVVGLSGAGYPNSETGVLGLDIRTKASQKLYNIELEAPEKADSGELFEVRLSFSHVSKKNLQSSAKLVVTNGELVGGSQDQDLLPDAVWRVQAGVSGTVGIVIDVETGVYPGESLVPSTTYLDSLSSRISVNDVTVAGVSDSDQPDLDEAFDSGVGRWVVLALVLMVVVIAAVGVLVWEKKKSHSGHFDN